MDQSSSESYPNLFRETVWPWGPTRVVFEQVDVAPPGHLISNVNLVPFIGEQWVILRLEDGSWEIPGGTLEPNETYRDAISRELLEEAGAALVSFTPVGAWDCHSEATKPFRPHLPFPNSYRFVCMGEVKIIGKPLNPPNGEVVASVELVSLEEACQRFRSVNRPDLAELYQLAARLRQPVTKERQHRYSLRHLHGISRLTLQHFAEMGVYTLEEVAAMTPAQLIRFKGIGKVKSVRIRAHAESLVTGEAIWHGTPPELCRIPGMMLDIETEFEPGKPWSFGWQKVGEPVRISVISSTHAPQTVTLADGQEIIFVRNYEAAWELIAEEAATVPGPIYHWSKYEVGVLQQSASPRLNDLLGPRLHDLLETYHKTVTMPVPGFSIKTIGAHLGQHWPDGEDAYAAWMAYLRWQQKSDHQILERPLAYLRADVAGLMLAWDWMAKS